MNHRIPTFFLLTLFGVSAVFLFLGHFPSVRAQRQNPLAVGVRVFQNPGNLPAALWYADRCAGGAFTKCGQPTPVAVDGYQGVKDKGTVYVNAANLTTAGLYTNIYLFALSEEAGEAGQAVFGEILKNIQFNTNIADATQRKALRRDVRRREGIAAFSRSLEAYRAQHSGQVPQLSSGSYIRGVSFSTWPSWQGTLGADLGAGLPTDPGKPDPEDPSRTLQFVGCGGRHDARTCWDERAAEMRCPVEGYVFGYRALSATDAVIGTTYEYNGTHNWKGENGKLDQVWNGICAALAGDAAADLDLDGVLDRIDNCSSLANGNQKDTDRDGIGDACDACPLDDRNDVDGDGICANLDSCPFNANLGTDRDGDGIDDACDSQFCGDGKQDAGEECDGTTDALRGRHQSCRPNCTIQQLTHCGDGQKQATNEKGETEQCDREDGVGPHQQCLPDCTLKTLTYCGDGRIQRPNEEGKQMEECDPNGDVGVGSHQRCRSNCTLQNLTYCGDGALQNPNDGGVAEQCDGTDGIGPNQRCTPACRLETLTHCGDGTVQNPNQRGVAEQCEGSGAEPAQCITTAGYAGTKTRNCTENTCQWGAYSACTTTQSCGDGVKNGPEACDPADPTKAGVGPRQQCTTSCTLESVNICGDGIKEGSEQCDMNAAGTSVDLGSPAPSCSSLGWGEQGQVGCDRNTCRYYGGGCAQGDLRPGDVRVKIIWPSAMKDIDAHLVVPAPPAEVPKIGLREFQGEIFYQYVGSVFSAPFAWLSWDDTRGNLGETAGTGMEIVTITQHDGAYYPGTYKFYLINYSSFGGQDVRVEVYTYKSGEPKNAEKVRSYTNRFTAGRRQNWYVFDFSDGTFTDRNVIQATAP